jgi:hypothetical protein
LLLVMLFEFMAFALFGWLGEMSTSQSAGGGISPIAGDALSY